LSIGGAAPVDVPWGADELNYAVTKSGSLLGVDSGGEILALSEGNTHSFELDTSIVGVKSGTIMVTSDGQGIAGGVVEIPVAYEVVVRLPGDYSGNEVVDQADLDLVLTSWGKPYDELPGTWAGDVPTEGIIGQAELDAVLTSWGHTGGALAAGGLPASGVPEPATAALLLCLLTAPWLCRRLRAQHTSIMSKVWLCAVAIQR
jgi:hypothetical protein